MAPESVTLNGSAALSGALLVPGTPALRQNGAATLGGITAGTGAPTPINYLITLEGRAALGGLVTATDAVSLPVVAAPPTPTGTRTVVVSSATEVPTDFATVRDLTLNGNLTTFALPAGTYGAVTVNGSGGLTLGTAGATQPDAYGFQTLNLGANAHVTIAGPVVLTVAQGISLATALGDPAHPDWLS